MTKAENTQATGKPGNKTGKAGGKRRRGGDAAGAVPGAKMRLPDFVCIGAQKAGTAWLAQILLQHPGAWNPGIKEIHYFDKTRDGRVPPGKAERLVKRIKMARNQRRMPELPAGLAARIGAEGMGLEDYGAFFSKAPEGKLVWEITPSYSSMSPKRIDEMLRILPEAKFIYLIRDPVSRSQSSLRMKLERSEGILRLKTPRDEVARAWLDDDKAVSKADYAQSVPRWDKRLEGTGRLLYLPFGMIKTDPAALVRQIEDFLWLAHFDGYTGLTEPYHQTLKIELPDFAVAEIEARMERHRAFLRERFGEEFAAQT